VIFWGMFGGLEKKQKLYITNNYFMHFKKLVYTFCVISSFTCNQLKAQSVDILDSISTVLENSKLDTSTSTYFVSLMEKKFNNQIEIQEKIGNWIISNALTKKDNYSLAIAYNALGSANVEAFKGKEAIAFFLKSIELCEKNNFPLIYCKSLIGLSRYYRNNEQQLESIPYLEQAAEIAKKNKFVSILSNCMFSLSATLEGLDKRHNSDTFLRVVLLKREGIKLSLKDSAVLFNNNLGLAETFSNYKYFDSAIIYLTFAKKFIGIQDSVMNRMKFLAISAKAYKEKATAQNSTEDYRTAIVYNIEALKLSENLNSIWWTNHLLKGLAIEHNGIGDYKNAYKYLLRYTNLHDSLFESQNFTIISEIKNKYESQKKENEIIKLSAENKQKSILNNIFIGATIGITLLAFLGYRNLIAKRKLQQSKIIELEKDKQLSTIDAMLQGQEEERSRIAKDLHDGLGGMLSGTKLSFENMKENLVLTPENATQFDKSLSMLDNTIADLRKVAHNLMPEALVKFGLQEAVRDFCNSIQSSNNLKVVYQPLGEQQKLSNTAEVFSYRIIQELVNNAVKHANATQIIVQLTTNNNKVGIAVEDDGKGFDINALANSKGAGMDNIKYRVQYFNGTIDTVTSAGNGTSVNIELSV
jgi:signal transduction histidine kinase